MATRVGQLNRRVSEYTSSPLKPPQRPDRLFLRDDHELNPPVATASSTTRHPSYIEQSEAAVNTKYGAGIRYRGTEYITNLTSVSAPAGQSTERGQVLYAMPISPQLLADTRLQLASQMYTRYIFRKIKFYYAGTAPTTTTGSLMMFGDYDPSQNPAASPGDAALRYAFTHNCAEFSVWQQACCEINDSVYADMLYCDPDEELRWSVQGCFWLLSSGALPAATELGKLVVEYEIDFAVPDYRGSIDPGTLWQGQCSIASTAAGTSLRIVPSVIPARGSYAMRIDQTPSAALTFNVSKNAYDQAATPLTLAKGMLLWCVTDTNPASGLVPLWTPDMYSLLGAGGSLGLVSAAAAGSTVTFNVTLYPLEKVAND